MQTVDLVNHLFPDPSHALAAPMATWLASSRRFTAFVSAFRTKIRKKIRSTQEEGALLDLRLELETAYLLLGQRTLSVEYEPQPLRQARGPDFAVTFTTSMQFMVEVTRLRAERQQLPVEAAAPPSSPGQLLGDRLADTVCGKLGQLLPQRANVLVVGVDALQLSSRELRAALVRVLQRIERDDPALMQRHRFRDRADFFQQFRRLSEIVVRGPEICAAASVVVWVNPQAASPLPAKVRTALYHSHAG